MLSLYVGLELQSLAAYVLASFMRRDTRSAEAGLKYFVLGALASGILLYGISLVYGFSGTTAFDAIAAAYRRAAGRLGLLFGLVFVFAGLAFKIAAVPFHMWTPDVYEGAPTPVTAFFASAPKVAAIGARGPRRDRGDGAGDGRLAPDRDLRRAGLDLPRRGRGDRPDQHQAAAGLFVDQQRRLRADRPRGGHARGRGRGAELHDGLCRDDARQLPGRAADARDRRPADRGRSPACPACRGRGPAWPRRWRCSCSRSPASRRCSASGQVRGVRGGGRRRAVPASRWSASRLGDRRILLPARSSRRCTSTSRRRRCRARRRQRGRRRR